MITSICSQPSPLDLFKSTSTRLKIWSLSILSTGRLPRWSLPMLHPPLSCMPTLSPPLDLLLFVSSIRSISRARHKYSSWLSLWSNCLSSREKMEKTEFPTWSRCSKGPSFRPFWGYMRRYLRWWQCLTRMTWTPIGPSSIPSSGGNTINS